MKLPKIFEGIGGDALTGVAMAAAVGANPLLGLLATPYLADRRKGMEIGRKGREIENEMGQRKLDMLDALPGIFSAQQSTGVMAPGAQEAEAMRVAGTLPALAPYLLENKGSRDSIQEQIAQIEAALGRKLTPEEIQMKFGLVARPKVLTEQEQRVLDMNERLTATQLRMAEFEESQALEGATRQKEAARDGVTAMSGVLFEVDDALDVLSGDPLLAPGIPFSEEIGKGVSIWNRMSALAGSDNPKSRKAVDAQQALVKNSDRFVSEYLNFREANGLGAPSVSYMNVVKNFAPNTSLGEPTLRGIVAATASDMLRAADRLPEGYGLSAGDRSRLSGIVSRYRANKKEFSDPDEVEALMDTGVLRPGDSIVFQGEVWDLTQEDFQ